MPSKATIQKISSLSHKKFRDELGLFVAEGDRLVEDLLRSPLKVELLFVTENSILEGYPHPQKEWVSELDMKRLSGLKTPSSSLAVVQIPEHSLDVASLQESLTLVLDGIQDPGNLGTIIRLSDWFGIRQLICSPDTADCYNPKVVQASMGAISHVAVHYHPLPQLLDKLAADTPIYGAFLDGENIYSSPLQAKGLIVMGNEGNGISKEVERYVQHRLHIPSFSTGSDKSESLNVAVATAITCSEFRRRL